MSASSRGWHHRTYTVNSPVAGESGFQGRNKAGAYGNLWDWRDVVWLDTFDQAPVTNFDTRSIRQ